MQDTAVKTIHFQLYQDMSGAAVPA